MHEERPASEGGPYKIKRTPFPRRDQTKPSVLATAFFASGFCFWAPMETNWSRVGSAQQYQGSLRNGTPAWDRGGGLICGAGKLAAACAAFQMRSNVAGRDSFFRPPPAERPKESRPATFQHIGR